MSAPFFNPNHVWKDIDFGYTQAAHLRNCLDQEINEIGLNHVQEGLRHLHQRITHLGELLSRAHDPQLKSNYASLKFQANVLDALVDSRLGSLQQRQPLQVAVPSAPPQQPPAPLSPTSATPPIRSPLALALPRGNFVEGSMNQFGYARAHNIQGGYEACTPIAANTALLLFSHPPAGPDELRSGHVDQCISRGMYTCERLIQGRQVQQQALLADLENTTENEVLRHDLRSRQISFAELNLQDFPGLHEAAAMSTSTLKKPEDATAVVHAMIQRLHTHNQTSGRNGAAAIITHGGKTHLALLLNETIYVFDSHGFSGNEVPAYIAHFTGADAAAAAFLSSKLSFRAPQTLLSPDQIREIVSENIAIEQDLRLNNYGISDKVLQEELQAGIRRYQEDQTREVEDLNRLTIHWLVPTSALSPTHPTFALENESKREVAIEQPVQQPTRSYGEALHASAQKAFGMFRRFSPL